MQTPTFAYLGVGSWFWFSLHLSVSVLLSSFLCWKDQGNSVVILMPKSPFPKLPGKHLFLLFVSKFNATSELLLSTLLLGEIPERTVFMQQGMEKVQAILQAYKCEYGVLNMKTFSYKLTNPSDTGRLFESRSGTIFCTCAAVVALRSPIFRQFPSWV